MSLRLETPCDFGPCPYDAEYGYTCEYWCGADEPEDYPYDEEDGFEEFEVGKFNYNEFSANP